jgi:hypothetical protein
MVLNINEKMDGRNKAHCELIDEIMQMCCSGTQIQRMVSVAGHLVCVCASHSFLTSFRI